ncbi:MAG: uroporphyrinogen-III synthase [Bacteroidetes bacterium]|nr:uroporphyrinogen-III synthase [Bacteroidota bacterium]
MKKVQSILVSQHPENDNAKTPYSDLAAKYKLKIDFRSFIQVQGVDIKDFRKQKVNIPEYTAVILTSKNAIDYFFRTCEEIRHTVPDTMKYFCMSETIANYLQKYVVYRKRKIFHGKQTFADLMDLIKKHKTEKFLLPSSDILKSVIPESLEKAGIDYTRVILYNTVASDLSDLENVFYDVLVFYSPAGIESLFKNFPKFKQKDTLIAAFGESTKKAVENAGLKCNIPAPQVDAPSMTGAIEKYIKQTK